MKPIVHILLVKYKSRVPIRAFIIHVMDGEDVREFDYDAS